MHEHHRDRLREKAIKDISLLNEYELLELLLFGVVPRKNTNDIAHRLIDQFGSISAVFSADPQLMMLIEGVGKTVSSHIAAMNSVFKAVNESRNAFPTEFTFNGIKQPLIDFFRPLTEEALIVFFLDKNNKIITRRVIYGKNRHEVEIDLNEFSRMILMSKAASIAIAHNHFSGNVNPSEKDDAATFKIATAAILAGTKLLDHIIICRDQAFSYFRNGKLEAIKEKAKRMLEE